MSHYCSMCGCEISAPAQLCDDCYELIEYDYEAPGDEFAPSPLYDAICAELGALDQDEWV